MTYLYNVWYCGGFSSELGEEPLGRSFFGKPYVFFRDGDGRVAMLDGACPHRFAPLSLGQVDGNSISCPYHGLVFDRSGKCILNPHGRGVIPPNAKLRSYPVIERHGIIWFWPGDPALAGIDSIIDPDWLGSTDYACLTGYMRTRAHYQLVVDNLLDLTHASYLHRDTLAGKGVPASVEFDFHVDEGDVVHADYLLRDLAHPAAISAGLWGERPSDFRAEMAWHPASTLVFSTFNSPPGVVNKFQDSLHQPSLHLLTPETEKSTHYFYVSGRNRGLDYPEQADLIATIIKRAFEQEDEPMIAACQSMMGETHDLFSLQPAILETDIAAVQARRLLAKRIRAEQAMPSDRGLLSEPA